MTLPTIVCAYSECTVIFTPSAHNQTCCCKGHRDLHRRARNTKLCESAKCQKQFSPRDKHQRFCSRSCSGSTVQTGRERKTRTECPICKTKFLGKSDTCSLICKVMLRRDTWFEKAELGDPDTQRKLPTVLRQALLEEANWQCEKCSWGEPNPVTGKPILTVNHVDGNWRNNRRSNLEVICYNCHTLTPTFGALNRGSISGTRPYSESRTRK